MQHFLKPTEGRLPVGAPPGRRWAEQVLLLLRSCSAITPLNSAEAQPTRPSGLRLLARSASRVGQQVVGAGHSPLRWICCQTNKKCKRVFQEMWVWGARVEFSRGRYNTQHHWLMWGWENTTSEVGCILLWYKVKINVNTFMSCSLKASKLKNLFPVWLLTTNAQIFDVFLTEIKQN